MRSGDYIVVEVAADVDQRCAQGGKKDLNPVLRWKSIDRSPQCGAIGGDHGWREKVTVLGLGLV